MEITNQQIAEFLSNKCSAGDAKRIAAWLQDNPAALDAFFNEAEWEQFETSMQVDEATNRDILARIRESQHSTRIIKMPARGWWQIAAVLLLFIGGAFLYKYLTHKPTVTTSNSQPLVVITPQEVILTNTNSQKVRYQLDDSSVVVLSQHSQLKYYKPFEAHKRDLYLDGEGFFEVTKDAHRPFTVFAKGFSTTALGTSFMVSAYKNKAMAHVKLYTGKVVVKNLQQANNAIYLLPGGECAFDYRLANLTKTQEAPTPPHVPVAGSIEETGEYVVFNSTRLSDVMKKLGELYHVRITYAPAVMQYKKFIGKVDRKSTVEEVLQTIAILNDLQITNNENEFTITTNK